jgi:hypothetical protein
MNRIVKEHYPAEKLPADLREGIDPRSAVTVTIVAQAEMRKPTTAELRQLLEEARRAAPGTSEEAAVARIRALRDEWDD